MNEYDEVLNKYHQKKKSLISKQRLNDLLSVSFKKLEEYQVLEFIRLLNDTLYVLIEIHSVNSTVKYNYRRSLELLSMQ